MHRLLDQHPQICMATPMRPEPKFFLEEDAAALGRAGYMKRHFGHHGTELWLGEKSTSYIERPDAIRRIRTMLPEARIIFLLRDPVARAYSNWCFSRMHGLEPLGFAEAIEAEEQRSANWDKSLFSVCPHAYAARGHYPKYLAQWERHFPREQILLMTSESLFEDHNRIRTVFSGLGLDRDIPLTPPTFVNASENDSDSFPQHAAGILRARYRDDVKVLRDDWGLDVSAWPT